MVYGQVCFENNRKRWTNRNCRGCDRFNGIITKVTIQSPVRNMLERQFILSCYLLVLTCATCASTMTSKDFRQVTLKNLLFMQVRKEPGASADSFISCGMECLQVYACIMFAWVCKASGHTISGFHIATSVLQESKSNRHKNHKFPQLPNYVLSIYTIWYLIDIDYFIISHFFPSVILIILNTDLCV